MSAESLLSIKVASKAYGLGAKLNRVLDRFSLDLSRGQVIAVVGPNGCGKTTLTNVASGIEKPDSGQVWINGRMTSHLSFAQKSSVRRQSIGIISTESGLISELTVRENVALPHVIDGFGIRQSLNLADRALGELGLQVIALALPSELTRVQRQLAAAARAFSGSKAIILADDPTSGLDPENQVEVISAIATRAVRGAGIIICTSDSTNLDWADEVVQLPQPTDGEN